MNSSATNGHLTLLQLANLDMIQFVKKMPEVNLLSFTYIVLILERLVAGYKFYNTFLK